MIVLILGSRFGIAGQMAQQVRKRRLLRTKQQQGQQQYKEWVAKALHGGSIKTQAADLSNPAPTSLTRRYIVIACPGHDL